MFEKYYKQEKMDPDNYEENYAKIFSADNKRHKKDYNYSYYSSYTTKLPYKIKIVNKLAELGRRSEACFFCKKTYCSNCELPEG